MDILLPVREASAAEPAKAPEPPKEERIHEIHNAMGDFLVIENPDPDRTAMSGMVGLEVGLRDRRAVVLRVEEDGPAGKAGLKKGQVILSIDGRSTHGVPLKQIVEALRGKPGTMVLLRIKAGWSPWGRKVPLIRAASWERRRRKDSGGVRVEEIPLKEMGRKSCPATWNGCLLLLATDLCTYSCPTEGSEPQP